MSRGPRDLGTASRLRKLGADLGTTALAATGISLALDGSRWSLALLALALLAATGRAVTMRRQSPRLDLLTSQLGQRALIGAGLASTLALLQPQHAVGAALGGVVLVGAVLYEPYLRPGSQLKVPVVAHLPGVPTTPVPADLSRQVLLADLGAVAAGLAVGALGLPAWWWALAAVLAAAGRVRVARDNARRAAALRRHERELPRAIADLQPEIALYTSWPGADGVHQVTMWLPYLQRTGRRCIVIARSSASARALAELVDVPVVEARGPADLDVLVVPSLRAAFYPNASSGNGVFVRYQQLTHVFLGHGDSDKPTSYNPTHAMYDRIFCAGPAAVRRYAEHGIAIPDEKFVVVGRPQVETIETAGSRPAGASPVVLYAPTWRGHVEETSLSSLPVGEGVVRGLLAAGATVVFRPHPFSHGFPADAAVIERIHRLLAEDRGRTGRPHLWGAEAETERSVVACFNLSDALVSDVSSVVSDYLFSGKPYAMVAVPTEPQAFRAAYPVARAAYVVPGDLADLGPALTTMLGEDPLAEVRRAQRVDYLGPFPAEGYASAFVAAVDAVASGGRLRSDVDDTGDDALAGASGAGADDSPADDEMLPVPGGGSPAAGPVRTPARRPRSRTRRRLRKLRRRLVQPRRWSQAAAVLALLALATALVGAPRLLPVLLGVAALTTVYGSVSASVHRRKRWPRLMGEARGVRVVLLCAAAVAAPPGRLPAPAALVVLVLLAVAVVGESGVQRAWGRLGLQVRNFPAMRTQVAEGVPRGLLPLAGSVAVLLALLAVLVPVPAGLLVAVAVLVFTLFVVVAVRALGRAARVVGAEHRLRDELTALAPEFAVYFAGTVGAGYQVGMWAPYFARIGRPFVVVTRSADTLTELSRALSRNGVDAPVILRPTLAGLQEVIVPSMTTAFYVNNAARNTHFIERRELTHVWLNHGDSEKPACYNPVHAIYDLIFTAGQAGIDRYARHGVHIPEEKFRVVGRPQVEGVQPAAGPVSTVERPTVLYAPTWQGPYADTRLFSLPVAVPVVQHLLDAGVRVVFRPHPTNYRFPACVTMIKKVNRLLARHRRETGVEHVYGSAAERAMSVEDCFNASDAMISDVSAMVTDYLHSGKPLAIVAVGRTPEQLVEVAPAARAAYVLLEDLSNLDAVVADLLGADPLAAVRAETRTYYLGDFPADRYADGFLDAARGVIDARSPSERRQAATLSTGE
ncbi:CDP-glycerol glycerophosphotransferase family protein [Friedmanniella luteola]|uniref:CDP-glycerol glycerophosphotransferase family protein n=1 Tax=Friedmanniella luteola TaxID=546871 RepID=UPI0012FE5F2F|nr:CDP-glycerol glycerophosphotransferase family protein [Friedmanniella luteola]